MDMILKIYDFDFRKRKIFKPKRTLTEFAKLLTEMTLTLFISHP